MYGIQLGALGPTCLGYDFHSSHKLPSTFIRARKAERPTANGILILIPEKRIISQVDPSRLQWHLPPDEMKIQRNWKRWIYEADGTKWTLLHSSSFSLEMR